MAHTDLFRYALLSLPALLPLTLACSGESGGDGGDGDGDTGEQTDPTWMTPEGATGGDGPGDGDGGLGAGATSGTGGDGSGGTGGTTGDGGTTGVGTGGTLPGSGGGPAGACEGVTALLSESEFNALFPNRNSAYTYQGMVDAVAGAGDLIGFPLFANEGDCDTRKRELAAFLANVARETGQLVYIEQINKSFPYCDQGQAYGCPAGSNSYYGRGPIQLSWNYNYHAASLYLFGDTRLLQTPGLVATDPAVAWSTGFWFWMLGGAGGDGSYSPHSVMVDGEGLGATIDIINGYEECNGGTQSYAQEAVSQRVCYYEKYAAALGVTVGSGNLNCGTTTNDSHCEGI